MTIRKLIPQDSFLMDWYSDALDRYYGWKFRKIAHHKLPNRTFQRVAMMVAQGRFKEIYLWFRMSPTGSRLFGSYCYANPILKYHRQLCEDRNIKPVTALEWQRIERERRMKEREANLEYADARTRAMLEEVYKWDAL